MKRNCATPILFLLFLVGLPLWGETIIVDPNPPVSASGIQNQVTGADLTGLLVTATYETPGGSTTVSAVWNSTGAASGSATGQGFSLSVTSDADAALAWQYSSQFSSPLTSLVLDGTSAGIFFDRAHSGLGTPGSGSGADLAFGPLLGDTDPISVTYSSAVSLDGQPAQNDLYAKISIDFSGLELGGLEPQDFAFTQPTDLNAIPEPKSWILLLMGIGVVALAGMSRFRENRI